MQSLGMGVLSGVVASLIILFSTSVVKGVLLPWYRQFVYKGVDISGSWRALKNPPDPPPLRTLTLELVQQAHSITGAAIITATPEDVSTPRSFKLVGSLSDRFLEFRMKQVDKKQLGIVVGLFEVIGDGNTMSGVMLGYNIATREINPSAVTLVRSVQN